jgi:glycerate 2-kinase
VRVIVAPDKFKGSLTAPDAAAAIARGVKGGGGAPEEIPIADGGEGTLDVLVAGAGGTIMGVIAHGPLGVPVRAHLARLADGTGVVEMAQASGLQLVPERERDVMRATSRGTGELIKGALARRPHRIVVAVGGSATVDGGTGLAGALGVKFLDDAGKPLPDGGRSLERIAKVDASQLDSRLSNVELIVACDVLAPLLGPRGAARSFGPQKGARTAQVEVLERGLGILAQRLKTDLGADVAERPGAGAAGGVGAMLMALGAAMRPGAEVVLETVDFRNRLKDAGLVITGEGRLDAQTAQGKAPAAVAAAAREAGVPVVALVGEATAKEGFDDVRSLLDLYTGDRDQAMREASEGLTNLARRVVSERLRGRP